MLQMDTAMLRASLDNISVIVVQLSALRPACSAPDTCPAHLRGRFSKQPAALQKLSGEQLQRLDSLA